MIRTTYSSLLKHQRTLVTMLEECEGGGFRHLNKLERAQVQASIKSRLFEVAAELESKMPATAAGQ
jgi:hypothetical protein